MVALLFWLLMQWLWFKTLKIKNAWFAWDPNWLLGWFPSLWRVGGKIGILIFPLKWLIIWLVKMMENQLVKIFHGIGVWGNGLKMQQGWLSICTPEIMNPPNSGWMVGHQGSKWSLLMWLQIPNKTCIVDMFGRIYVTWFELEMCWEFWGGPPVVPLVVWGIWGQAPFLSGGGWNTGLDSRT